MQTRGDYERLYNAHGRMGMYGSVNGTDWALVRTPCRKSIEGTIHGRPKASGINEFFYVDRQTQMHGF